MKLIITRHGETEENIAGIMQGHLPGKLSDNGINQAKKLALRLKDEKIDFIFSSDLARAADTAKEVARFHPNTPFELTEDLRERNLGEFQGKKKSDFGWDVKFNASAIIQSKTGETTEKLYERAESFIHETISKYHDATVLFVGHNGINKALLTVITEGKHEDISGIENQHNTSINICEIDVDKNYKIHTSNCIKHLD